jgi:hypothetical protein
MKFIYPALLSFALPVLASQIFFMELSDDLLMSDNIFLARVENAVTIPADYIERREYTLSVLEVIVSKDSLEDTLVGAYSMYLPRPYITSSGDEIWESPIVNGSGMEMLAGPGDTVLVFSGLVPSGTSSVPVSIIRLEYPDSLDRVLELLAQ